MRKIIFIIFITVITFIFGAREARAQSLSLSISPPLLEVIIKPGKSITQVYKLTNTGEPVVVTAKIMELDENGFLENKDFTRENWISMISNDIDFDKPFLLQKDKTAEFLLKVNPPTDVVQQDYYRALVFTTTPQPAQDTTMTSFVENLGSPLIITVSSTGIFTKGAQITNFQLPQVLDSFDNLTVDVTLKNTGTTYFHTPGKITLSGPVGTASFDLLPNIIFSGQTRLLLTDHATSSHTLALPGFYIGKYQVSVDLTLDENGAKINAVKTFYAVPWKALILMILLIIGIKLLKSPRKK